MFNQYEVRSADISESRIMNSLMSAVNKAAAIEDGPTEMSEAALVSMAKLGDSDAFVELEQTPRQQALTNDLSASPGIGMMLKTRSRMQR